MLRRLLLLFVLVIAGWGLFVPLAHAGVNDFTIESFEADYYLEANSAKTSKLEVTEKIVADFPMTDQNHGLLRAIPNKYKDHSLGLVIHSVTDDTGKPWAYTKSEVNDNQQLKIGNANTYVHGLQTYVIKYSLRDVASFYEDHEEFYWDINGSEWPQSMGVVTGRIHLKGAAATGLQDRQSCFAGKYEANDANCQISRQVGTDETLVTVEAAPLLSNQSLTVVLGFNKGTFVLSPAAASEIQGNKLLGLIILTLLVFVNVVPLTLIIILLYVRWRKYGRDPEGRGTIVPEYSPPKAVGVLESDIILKEKFRNEAISATLIELAVQGYVTIYEIDEGKDYNLELKADASALGAQQQAVVTMFFGATNAVGQRVSMNALKTSLSSKAAILESTSTEAVRTAGFFVKNPKKVRQNYYLAGMIITIVSVFGLFIFIGIGAFIGGLLLLVFAHAMPARTAQGVELRDYLLGLKMYIGMAEKDRIAYLQTPKGAEKASADLGDDTPAGKIKLFEKLLPYAMIFGMEKEWAKQFEGLYSEPPDWYHGNSSTFTTAYLLSSMNSFNSTVASSVAPPPSSSSSSGFSGGGFSGGGGGGGGGGGW